MKKEFMYAFKINRMVIFEVEYISGPNPNPYFATSSGKFVRNKRDWSICGQCQEEVLNGYALEFYKKWDKFHLKDLEQSEYGELVSDIEKLKETYQYIHKENGWYIPFSAKKELSMRD